MFYYISKRGLAQYGALVFSDEIEQHLKLVDLVLATRLTDKRFRGIFNFEKAVVVTETPIDEIQKALVRIEHQWTFYLTALAKKIRKTQF